MTDSPHRDERPRRRWLGWLGGGLIVLALVGAVGLAVFREVHGTLEPTPWATVDAHGTGLTVEYVGSECRDEASLDVVEDADRVVVTVRERVGASSCSDVGVLYTAQGRLEEPLGDRDLVDGACLTDEWKGRPACVPADQ
jgi:hypothetical protein